MSLVPSLLQAIVKVDGEALVMHPGDRPYVVSPGGQVELASRGLTLDAVNGIVGQLLPAEIQSALDEFGAIQHHLPARPEFPGEHFTVVAARGGDDVWVEVRRRRVVDEDRVPEELLTPSAPPPVDPALGLPVVAAIPVLTNTAAQARGGVEPTAQSRIDPGVAPARARHDETPAAQDDDLRLPDADQLWPARNDEWEMREAARTGDDDEVTIDLDADLDEEPQKVQPIPQTEVAEREAAAEREAIAAAAERAAAERAAAEREAAEREAIAAAEREAAAAAQREAIAAAERAAAEHAAAERAAAERAAAEREAAEREAIAAAEREAAAAAQREAIAAAERAAAERAAAERAAAERAAAEREAAERAAIAAAERAAAERAAAERAAAERAEREAAEREAIAAAERERIAAAEREAAAAAQREAIAAAERAAAERAAAAQREAAEREAIAAAERAAAERAAAEREAAEREAIAAAEREAAAAAEREAIAAAERAAAERAAAEREAAERKAIAAAARAAAERAAAEREAAERAAAEREAIAAAEREAIAAAASLPPAPPPAPTVTFEARAEPTPPAAPPPPEPVPWVEIPLDPMDAFAPDRVVAAAQEPIAPPHDFVQPLVDAIASVEPPHEFVEPTPPAETMRAIEAAEPIETTPAIETAPPIGATIEAAELFAATQEPVNTPPVEPVAPPRVEPTPSARVQPIVPPRVATPIASEWTPPIREPYREAPGTSRMAPPSDQSEAPPPAVVLPISRSPIRADHPVQAVADPPLPGLERLLRVSSARGASTLYLSSDSQPSIRVDGELQILDAEPVHTSRDVESLLLSLMPERSHEALGTGALTEWICDIDGVGRVRCMSFRDHRGPGGVFRLMSARTISVEQLGLPRHVQSLAIEPEGLVLVAGPRSSGKRTLMAAFVDLMNRTRRDHIITIEREINVMHERGHSFISQREVRGNDDDMLAAARGALREDPDVLVIEELRTGALMNVALEAVAAGRLVIAGFSAHTATEAIDRIIDLYAPEYRRQVQFALADSLRGVVVQVLLRKVGGGRLPARELLLNTPAVSGVIAEGKTSQLPMAIEGGRRYGMMPLNDALVSLVQTGAVEPREAYRQSPDRPGFLAALNRQGIDTSFVERLA